MGEVTTYENDEQQSITSLLDYHRAARWRARRRQLVLAALLALSITAFFVLFGGFLSMQQNTFYVDVAFQLVLVFLAVVFLMGRQMLVERRKASLSSDEIRSLESELDNSRALESDVPLS